MLLKTDLQKRHKNRRKRKLKKNAGMSVLINNHKIYIPRNKGFKFTYLIRLRASNLVLFTIFFISLFLSPSREKKSNDLFISLIKRSKETLSIIFI